MIQPDTVFDGELDRLVSEGRLYAIIDACGHPDIPGGLASIDSQRVRCLYRGHAAENFAHEAPYLVEVDSTLLGWIHSRLWWDEAWGLFISLPDTLLSLDKEARLQQLHRHLRRYLTVLSPAGEEWLFRYYDPRLLPLFLEACEGTEAAEFFGPIEQFIIGSHGSRLRTIRYPDAPSSRDSSPRRSEVRFQLRQAHVSALQRPSLRRLPETMVEELRSRSLSVHWEPATREIVHTDGRGLKTRLKFDERYLPCAIVPPSGRAWNVVYDERGKFTALINPDGPALGFGYDERGRLASLERPDGIRSVFEHDERNRLTRIRHPDGSETRCTYTDADTLSCVIDRVGAVTRFLSDSKGHLVEKIDALGRSTRYEWNEEESVHTTIFPDGLRETQELEPDTGRRTLVLRDGHCVTVDIDEYEHPRALRYGDERRILLHCVGGDEVRLVENESIRIELNQDDAGRLLESTFAGGLLRQSYDPDGRLLERSFPDGCLHSYEYNTDGQLVRIRAWGAEVEFKYSPGGTVQERIYRTETGVPLVEQREYANAGRLSMARIRSVAAQVLSEQRYRYDTCDRLGDYQDWCPFMSDWHRQRFHHAPEGRLLEESCLTAPGRTYTYAYDAKGNMVRDGSTHLTIGLMDEVRTRGARALEYDVNGRLLGLPGGQGELYCHFADSDDLLRVDVAGRPICFEYDGLGRRVRKREDQRVWTYHWVGQQMLWEEFTSSPGSVPVRREYLYLPQPAEGELEGYAPIAFREDGRIYWLQQDTRGATIRAFSEHGEVAWAATYDSFGRVHVLHAGVRQPWRLLGQYEDEETGLYYNYGRYYSPLVKQYLSRDPNWEENGATAYSYCDNDPLNRVDPLGQLPFLVPVLIFVARVAVSVAVGMLVDYLVEKATEAIGHYCKACARALGVISGIASFLNFWKLVRNVPKIIKALPKLAKSLPKLLHRMKVGWRKLPKPWNRWRRTRPSGTRGQRPSGTRTSETGSQKQQHMRENQAADVLANKGYKVEQNPGALPNGKQPDYKIEGKYFDCLSPKTTSIDQVRKGISDKVSSGQTERIVLNLDDSSFSPKDVADVLARKPKEGLKEVIAVKNGVITHVFPP